MTAGLPALKIQFVVRFLINIIRNYLKSISNRKTHTDMSSGMYQYGIGGNEVKPDASESINEIQGNKTLIAQKLTDEEALFPEAVKGLTTIEEVFAHFKPHVSVDFENEQGQSFQDDIRFNNLGDFGVKRLTEQSSFLADLNVQKEQYTKIAKQIKTNKVLRSMLENQETRAAFMDALQSLCSELDAEQ